jgi:hypothetical protein
MTFASHSDRFSRSHGCVVTADTNPAADVNTVLRNECLPASRRIVLGGAGDWLLRSTMCRSKSIAAVHHEAQLSKRAHGPFSQLGVTNVTWLRRGCARYLGSEVYPRGLRGGNAGRHAANCYGKWTARPSRIRAWSILDDAPSPPILQIIGSNRFHHASALSRNLASEDYCAS